MSLSIVIPAFNEEEEIGKTLNRIFSLMSDLEGLDVIVVNNGSTDNTANIVKGFTKVLLIDLKEKITVAAARNLGWRKAKYDLIAFLDADILITQQWSDSICEFVKGHLGQELVVTGCRVSISETPSYIEKVWFDSMQPPKQGGYINSGNLITTRAVLEKVSGFSEHLISGEDVDFCVKAKLNGARIISKKQFFVHHEGYPKTLRKFFLRERWHGAGDMVDFKHFFQSKIALISVMFVSLIALSLFLAIGFDSFAGLAVLSLAVFLNLAFVAYRFGVKNIKNYPALCLLNSVYLFARVSAFFYRKRM